MSALVDHFASNYTDQKYELRRFADKTFVAFRGAIYYLDIDLAEFINSPHIETRAFEVCYETLISTKKLKCISV